MHAHRHTLSNPTIHRQRAWTWDSTFWGMCGRAGPGTQKPLGRVLSTSRNSADTHELSGEPNAFLFCMPQPETEDEKKRFEEGKGRYLQMKAKRQGHTDPQP